MEKYDEAIDMYTKLSEFWPDNPRVSLIWKFRLI